MAAPRASSRSSSAAIRPRSSCNNYNLTTSIFVARGVLADLASLQGQTIDPNIQALVTQYASYHGETGILPYSVAAEGVIYNVDLFNEVMFNPFARPGANSSGWDQEVQSGHRAECQTWGQIWDHASRVLSTTSPQVGW